MYQSIKTRPPAASGTTKKLKKFMNNKTLTKRFIFAAKKGFTTPTLPKDIVDFTMLKK